MVVPVQMMASALVLEQVWERLQVQACLQVVVREIHLLLSR